MKRNAVTFLALSFFMLMLSSSLYSQEDAKPVVLQEMSWFDVQEYLKTSDMVIIPLGSTEQHGPHLPLGTDFYESFGMSKIISERTGVMVAPVLFAGYSLYHTGFPGTLSLKPETMEQVVFECAEQLIKYGFRKIMFFNYHGGNNVVQQKLILRINHETKAVAIAIGVGSPVFPEIPGEPFDWHAGLSETSLMLYLKPELVRMERAVKPEIHFTPQMEELRALAEETPQLSNVLSSLLGVPAETGKGGASHELSSNGIWSFSDPKAATAERGEKEVDAIVDAAVKLIEAWKKVGLD
ncbi:MAG TPA: creatininase family protein [Acidobacteriota bacterium]|nr:creatininase family protein [Acidobacteriota bacterium]